MDLDYLEMGITTAIKQDNAWISPEQSQSVIQRVKSNNNYSKQSGDSAAYAIGLSIGTNMNKDGISNLNLTILMNGVKETFSKRPQVSEKVAAAVITNYLTMVKIEKGNENYSTAKVFKAKLKEPRRT
ncbi:MAG: FKBP-type peptidyl-prolyl cis-trans isomerase N-terminal domain-containing protein [Bacteroidetes bacterium]|nr:FKBP-type peptidyl-prolyl cis-trans isomerase N-terminal domain-containing protein [Bacteroidota bacterium]